MHILTTIFNKDGAHQSVRVSAGFVSSHCQVWILRPNLFGTEGILLEIGAGQRKKQKNAQSCNQWLVVVLLNQASGIRESLWSQTELASYSDWFLLYGLLRYSDVQKGCAHDPQSLANIAVVVCGSFSRTDFIF